MIHNKTGPAVVKTIDVNTRWEQGVEHDPRSEEIVRWIADYDFEFCDDSFCWKVGGDGDNGEDLMYELDEYFAARDKAPKNDNDYLYFGDYVEIEQKRYGCENEMYLHKVIGTLESNIWVDVPVQTSAKETSHKEYEPVVRCICCGVCETEVLAYRVKDVKKASSKQWNI
jgi:hypothetical protein